MYVMTRSMLLGFLFFIVVTVFGSFGLLSFRSVNIGLSAPVILSILFKLAQRTHLEYTQTNESDYTRVPLANSRSLSGGAFICVELHNIESAGDISFSLLQVGSIWLRRVRVVIVR